MTDPTGEYRARLKGIYVGAPACFELELACQQVAEAFGGYGCYVVGSALEKPDWRDVDVRLILSDREFAALFPTAGDNWEFDARWLLLTTAISQWLAKRTGLPIDFQFQPQTHANARHKGRRNAVGIRIAPRSQSRNRLPCDCGGAHLACEHPEFYESREEKGNV